MSSKNNHPEAIVHMPEDTQYQRDERERLTHRAHAVGLDPKYATHQDVVNEEEKRRPKK